jgi:NAD+ dependent glucose-6-phosphate dehydrogenase
LSKIAVTGASGRIGASLCANLSKDHEIVRIDIRGIDTPVYVENLEMLQSAIAGCETLIHLATFSGAVKSSWEDVQRNLLGIYNAFEAARLAGCGRMIFASSNHAVGMYEVLALHGKLELQDGTFFLGSDASYRADGLYGVGKAFGEVLGRYYSDEFGMKVACIRIGSITANDSFIQGDMSRDLTYLNISDDEKPKRLKRTWMSQLDFARLCRAILASDVAYGVVYGISDNPTRFLDLEAGRALYGFWPVDGAG